MREAPGCSYREREDKPPCNKVCDAGETMCPHHLLLTKTAAAPKPPAKEDSKRKFRTPRGYDE
jgi:hypothetical protein